MGWLVEMKSLKPFELTMVDQPDLEGLLRKSLYEDFSKGMVDLCVVRELVSSPRLKSYGVQAFSHPGLVLAGDSFLDANTMLADGGQKTYAISLDEWREIEGSVERIDYYDFRDRSLMKVQIWSVNPLALSSFAMGVAVALSYKRSELQAESRISSALNELMMPWGYYTEEF